MTYGEHYLQGDVDDEILISAHCCHPSLCNDNLSGVVVAAFIARLLTPLPRRHSFRFLWIPGTIGSITWLARNEERVHRIRHGLVLTCLGDAGGFTYKRSRRGDADVDRAVRHVLERSGGEFQIRDFSPYGYDERQYCSPGFNLAVGCLSRSPHGEFPQYHTSGDNPAFVRPAALAESLRLCLQTLAVLEANRVYVNLKPKCEPQLGKRGLYAAIGGRTQSPASTMAMLWVLNQSDGTNSLLDIAERSGIDVAELSTVAEVLREHGLLEERVV